MEFSKSYFNKIKSLDFNDFITHLIRHYVCPYYIKNSKRFYKKDISNEFKEELKKIDKINLGYKNTNKLSDNFFKLMLALNDGNNAPTFLLALIHLEGGDHLRLKNLREGLDIVQNMEKYVVDEILIMMLDLDINSNSSAPIEILKTNIYNRSLFMVNVFEYAIENNTLELESYITMEARIISKVPHWALVTKFLGEALYYFLLINNTTIKNGSLSTTMNYQDIHYLKNMIEATMRVNKFIDRQYKDSISRNIHHLEDKKTKNKKKSIGRVKPLRNVYAILYLLDNILNERKIKNKAAYIAPRLTKVCNLNEEDCLKSKILKDRKGQINNMLNMKCKLLNDADYSIPMFDEQLIRIAKLLIDTPLNKIPNEKLLYSSEI